MGKQKNPEWKSMLPLDKIDSWISIGCYRLALWYQLVKLDGLTCLVIIRKSKNTVGGSGSEELKFCRVCELPSIYLRTHSTISAALMGGNKWLFFEKLKMKTYSYIIEFLEIDSIRWVFIKWEQNYVIKLHSKITWLKTCFNVLIQNIWFKTKNTTESTERWKTSFQKKL